MKNLGENAWFFWEFNNKTDSTQSETITVNEKGNYTVFQKLQNCVSLDSVVIISPFTIPSPPEGSDEEVCATEPIQTLTAEATTSDKDIAVFWFDSASEGNKVLFPILDTIGTVTYYAESQNDTTGCISTSRTPVTLTIKADSGSTLIDTTIVGKPHNNVAVLIFPNSSLEYQWYLNNDQITNATGQYYYIFETDRIFGNIFSVEVELSNGCKAKFNYQYSGSSTENSINATNSSLIQDASKIFNIYPNPVYDKLNIAVDSKKLPDKQELTAKVYSINGACVGEIPLNQNPQSIDVGHLRPGFYSVTIYSNHTKLFSKKLTISKR